MISGEIGENWKSWSVIGLLTCGVGSAVMAGRSRKKRWIRGGSAGKAALSQMPVHLFPVGGESIWLCMTREQANEYIRWRRHARHKRGQNIPLRSSDPNRHEH